MAGKKYYKAAYLLSIGDWNLGSLLTFSFQESLSTCKVKNKMNVLARAKKIYKILLENFNSEELVDYLNIKSYKTFYLENREYLEDKMISCINSSLTVLYSDHERKRNEGINT